LSVSVPRHTIIPCHIGTIMCFHANVRSRTPNGRVTRRRLTSPPVKIFNSSINDVSSSSSNHVLFASSSALHKTKTQEK
jgi:hypothetical protein